MIPPVLVVVGAEVLPPVPAEPPLPMRGAFPPLGPASRTVETLSPLELHEHNAKENESTMHSLGAMRTMMALFVLWRKRARGSGG